MHQIKPKNQLSNSNLEGTAYQSFINAIKYVNGKMEHLNNQEKKLLQDIKEDAEAEDTEEVNSSPRLEEQQTHNGVF